VNKRMDVLGSAHGWISMQDPYKWRWIDQGYGVCNTCSTRRYCRCE